MEKLAHDLTLGSGARLPFSCEEPRSMGLPVVEGLSSEVCSLMDLYPQMAQRRPPVQYVPVPYRGREDSGGHSGRSTVL